MGDLSSTEAKPINYEKRPLISKNRYTCFKKNDILLAKLKGCFENLKLEKPLFRRIWFWFNGISCNKTKS